MYIFQTSDPKLLAALLAFISQSFPKTVITTKVYERTGCTEILAKDPPEVLIFMARAFASGWTSRPGA